MGRNFISIEIFTLVRVTSVYSIRRCINTRWITLQVASCAPPKKDEVDLSENLDFGDVLYKIGYFIDDVYNKKHI
jgi:hypothetical protein